MVCKLTTQLLPKFLTLKYFVPFSFVDDADAIFSSLLNSQFSLALKNSNDIVLI